MSHSLPRSAVRRSAAPAPPPNTSTNPPGPSSMSSFTVKPRPAAKAASTPQAAALAPMYSRAQLFVPVARPPMVVATMPMAWAIWSSVSLRSLAAATAPPKATTWDACRPARPPRRASPIRPAASYPTTIAASRSCPDAPVRSPIARPTDASVVPSWAVLRMSLSSDAAASLSAALTRATSRTGSLVPSNQIVASGLPPLSLARSRRMRAESISEPDAALANVLARIIFACSIACRGRSR